MKQLDKLQKTEHWLKSFLNFLIKNYLLIASIPILIGGAHQILKLSSVGFGYIRFFSVSQLIIDGLLIMIPFILIILLLAIFVYYTSFFSHMNIKIDENLSFNDEVRKIMNIQSNIVGANMLTAFIFSLIIFFNIHDIIYYSKLLVHGEFLKFYNQFISVNINFLLAYIIFYIFLVNLNVYRVKKKGRMSKIELLMWLSYYPFAILITNSLPQNINVWSELEQVGNYQKYHHKLKQEYPHYTNSKMLYFNDKYIFTELSSSDDKTIIITKMDDFVELND